jgi:hypothetical protein
MVLRGAMGEFDSGRRVDELGWIPRLRDARRSQRDERVQTVTGGGNRGGPLEERDPAFDLVELGSPMAHEGGRDRA